LQSRVSNTVFLILALALPAPTCLSGADVPDLAEGVRQVTEGDFEGAVLTLDAVIRGLAGDPARVKQAAQAYLYLGVAYVGLGQEAIARAKFRQALIRDRTLRMGIEEFPQRAIRAFEAARQAFEASANLEKETRRKGTKAALVLLGIGGAGAAGAALALAGDRANQPPTASLTIEPGGQALVAATRMTFTASASDPDGEPLSYFWTFGDGASASGEKVTHIYEREGAFDVVLTVRDGLTATRASGSVRARSVTGGWLFRGPITGLKEFVLEQTGVRIQATPVFEDPVGIFAESSRGDVSDPRRVNFQGVVCQGSCPIDCTNWPDCAVQIYVAGDLDSELQTITGQASCSGKVSSGKRDFCPMDQMPVTLTRR
jgi:hypothetical protein